MNTPIRRVSMAVIIMIVALLANSTYVQVFRADSLRADPRNNRFCSTSTPASAARSPPVAASSRPRHRSTAG